MKKNRRRKLSIARDPKQALRPLTGFEKSFLEEVKLYDKVIEVTKLISWNQHGIKTDGRGMRATRIFTRLTVLGLSLQGILPRPSPMKHHEDELWDVVSLASFARNLVEGYLALYYFGTEKITVEEAELRFFILQLHRNAEWFEIRKQSDPKDPGLKEFEEGIPEQELRIKNHPYLPSLTDAQRNRALQGLEMYKTKADFETELTVCKDLRRNYRLLSNHIHPLPMSIERIDNKRGRGIGSDTDVNYCLMCLMLARRFLAAATIGIADHFPRHLASRFMDELTEIRPLVSAGFEE
jgi:hypothetical protein